MGAASSTPDSAAAIIARVWPRRMRWPTPAGPPVQPVFTSHTLEPWPRRRSPSNSAYRPGGSGMKGEPKQAENVACGSVTPRSVPATFAV